MSVSRTRIAGIVVILLAAAPAPAPAPEQRVELGLSVGVLFPDGDVAGSGPASNEIERVFGGHGTIARSARLALLGDVLYSRVRSTREFGITSLLGLRGGVRTFVQPHPSNPRLFVDTGLGWMRLYHANRILVTDRAFLSLGVGQLFDLGDQTSFHWTLRFDGTAADDGDPVLARIGQPTALVGFTWRPLPSTDRDGDGVPNRRDACPRTPPGALVDASGCPLDADLDGVPDGIDECPETPRGIPVDSRGCSWLADSDLDGVPDGVDTCPDTPAGTRVNASGCPTTLPQFESDVPVDLSAVSFDRNSFRLTVAARAVLVEVAPTLANRLGLRVEVAGHADVSENAVVELSLRRAETVRAYLVAHGAPLEILEIRGYGSSRPIADNLTPARRDANRRVELNRID